MIGRRTVSICINSIIKSTKQPKCDRFQLAGELQMRDYLRLLRAERIPTVNVTLSLRNALFVSCSPSERRISVLRRIHTGLVSRKIGVTDSPESVTDVVPHREITRASPAALLVSRRLRGALFARARYDYAITKRSKRRSADGTQQHVTEPTFER